MIAVNVFIVAHIAIIFIVTIIIKCSRPKYEALQARTTENTSTYSILVRKLSKN